MPLQFRAFALIGFLVAAPAALAQSDPIQDPADRLLREQQERTRQDRLQQDTPEIALPQEERVDPNATPEQILEAEPTFVISEITFKGETVLPVEELHAVARAFTGIRLGVKRINLLLHRLTQAYVERGYVTTRVYVGEQNLNQGTLELTVLPGRVERLSVDGREATVGERLALPLAQGDILKLQDIEQGIDQLNRLKRNHVEVQLAPGTTPGGSVLSFSNDAGDWLYYSLGVDNHGDEATGQNRYRAGIEANDLLGLQESFALTYSGSLDTNALLFASSLPAGYNTFSYAYSYAEFQHLIADTAIVFGRSQGHTLGWNRVLGRSRLGKSAIDVSLSARASEREVDAIPLGEQRLSVLRLGYNRLRKFQLGTAPGYWTADIGYSRGLTLLGATEDAADLPAEGAHAQFDKFDASFSAGLQLSPAWNYRGSLNLQYASEALFASEQIYAGGAASVRGFKESALSGDRGATLRNELGYTNLPTLLRDRLRLEPYLYFDAGSVQLVADRDWRSIAALGVGVRAATKTLNAELIVGKPLSAADAVDDSVRLSASLNWTY